MTSQENIEAYITGQLTGKERLDFEGQISDNPLLQKELSIQEDIITSIKEYRKTQLKHKLNSINISNNFNIVKIISYLICSIIIAAGIYIYYNNNIPTPTSQRKAVIRTEDSFNENSKNVSKNNEPATKKQEPKASIRESETSIREPVSSNQYPISNTELNEIQSLLLTVQPVVFEDFGDNELIHKNLNEDLPGINIGQMPENKLPDVQISESNKDDNMLYYQYYNEKLFLYGDFSSMPYELLELNTLDDKLLYLFYDNSFYKIKQAQSKITLLVKITDEKVVEELNVIKGEEFNH